MDRQEVRVRSDACVRNQSEYVRYVEHVVAVVTVWFARRGDLRITLTSPGGTRSVMLPPRAQDTDDTTYSNWQFLSIHFWGENPIGTRLL